MIENFGVNHPKGIYTTEAEGTGGGGGGTGGGAGGLLAAC